MVEEFLVYISKEKRVSSHTCTAYKNDIESFLSFSAIENNTDLKEVSYQNVRSWIVELINLGYSNRTVNRKLSSLRTFFKWALGLGFVDLDPMLKIKGPKLEKRLPEFVKEEEIDDSELKQLFPDGFSGFRDRLMIEVLYQTGIRLSELINLKRSDIDQDKIKVLGKRNKERFIPLTVELFQQISAYLDHEVYKEAGIEYVFITDKGKKLYPKFVYRKVNYYLSLLTNLSKRSPHILRHTFATHMLNNGAGLETLKEVLGHASLSATQVYTHNSFDQISKIYKQSHPRGEKK
ncbi:tyrosine-type recombinase/integrase [Brumimicrobium aurantiacum]|uniref:Integrase n=1 Tax=Brumimicrobium aurantiacum TaxID=1737063 RepID=A0A3E1EY56_9FLAO|nr:tyrosine-type recombinase/integrase [Brumimicrobium aurantiacum]RFC54467.1 integrase [Brumimicrobium aurantiacum]